jgi:hypothetical protein
MKKLPSQRFIPQMAKKLAAKPSEMVELFGVSRNYLHKLSTGQRPLTGKLLEKVASLSLKDNGFKAIAPSLKQQQSNDEQSKTSVARKIAVAEKKINDLREELNLLQQTEDAMQYVAHLCDQFESKSFEHDWCKLHLRRLKHRLPKDPDMQRAEWEAKLAGLLAERKYWEKKVL